MGDPRLRARCRIAGLALLISPLVPVETQNDGARFLWRLAPDLGAASLLSLLAPALCGALVLVALRAARRTASLAVVMIGAVAGLFLVTARGAEALAGDLLPSQEPWRSEPLGALLAVALTVSAVHVQDRRFARGALRCAAACALAHLALPAGSEAPLGMMARVLAHVARASGPRNLMGACMLSAVVLWPAIAVGVGAWQVAQPATRPRSYGGLLALHGIPAILGPLAQRTLADPWDRDSSAAITLGSLALSAAVMVLLASAITALSEEDLAAERRTALASLGIAALGVLGISLLARPPRRDPDWHAGPPTPAGDHVFGELLSRWNDGRSGMEASLVSAAQDLDAGLGAALSALVTETTRGDLLERRWYRLIDRVNEASRRAELPYYVDPTGVISAGGDTRWYRLDVYRIERVSRFASSTGRTLTTLHVRALVPGRPRPAALGLSRDVQPYAVVAIDEIRAYQTDLERLAEQAPPRCGEGVAESAEAEEALRDCGEALAGSIARGELGPALLAATERHEIQHRIDGAAPRRSAWLGARLAWYEPAARARIERELSAYLAQMTAPGQAPRLTLMRLLRMALLVRRGVEHDVARLAFEALGGAPPDIYRQLAAHDDEALHRDAEGAYRAVFGRDLPQMAPQ